MCEIVEACGQRPASVFRQTLRDGGANLGQDRLDCIGVSRLRSFLEELLKQRYLRNLAYIVPQLQQACARAAMPRPAADPPACPAAA